MMTMIVNMGERVLFMNGAVRRFGMGTTEEPGAASQPVKRAPASEVLTADRMMGCETSDLAGSPGGMYCNDPS